MDRRAGVALFAILALASHVEAQEGPERTQYALINEPVVLLKNVRVIDGASAQAREGQHLLLRDGKIAALGTSIETPKSAKVLDLRGRTVMPGLVMLHEHIGFNELVPVNRMVPELLEMIPGVQVVETGYVAPGYMCASFAALPKALEDIHANTLRAAKAAGADAVVTTFHQCYREIVGLDAAGAIDVYNYIQLIARSMGLAYEDEYKAWKRSPEAAREMIGAERIAKVGIEFYDRAILPELRKRPVLK